MSRRPRGNCPVCRNTLSLRWSGDIRVLRKHSVELEPCAGSGRPAVGELAELHAGGWPEPKTPAPTAPAQAAPERIASVA